MTIPKGGRGKKAPYETQQMRVPTPIKDQVTSLITKFRGEILGDPQTDENLFKSVDNTKISAEIESLQIETQNLKTALEGSEVEKQNLKTALEKANQQLDNLSSALDDALSKTQNLSTSLEEEKQKVQNLSTGKPKTDLELDHRISEGEALKCFNLDRKILRNPREKGETKIEFKHEDRFIYLEYIGQPEGKHTTHYWKIIKIEYAPKNLSLAF